MKQIFYFLVGVWISAMILSPYAYADGCNGENEPTIDMTSFSSAANTSCYSCSPIAHFMGSFVGDLDGLTPLIRAKNAAQDAANASGYDYSSYAQGGTWTDSDGKIWEVKSYYRSTNQASEWHHYFAFYSWTALACPTSPDTDGDGIPNDQDMYPDDPTPYSVQMLTYYTDDGTASGNHVFEVWVTDRGDYFHVGDNPPEDSDGILVQEPTWIEAIDLVDSISIGLGGGLATPEQPTYTTGVPTGEASPDTATGMSGGTQSGGSETDNQALQGIMDNTGKTADNVKRLGDYMSELNASIQNMDRNISRSTGGGALIVEDGEGESETINDDEACAAGEADLSGQDVGAQLSEVNGDLVEGTDYDVPGQLQDETFVSDFINSNPLKTVFDSSGFTYTSSSCQQVLDLGALGTHILDICALEPGLILFGNLLVAFTTLIGLIHVATGRGF